MGKSVLKAVVALLLVVAFCIPASAQNLMSELSKESVISKVIERNKLRVGFSTFVPWAMKDKNGDFIGFEIDVMTELAKDLGVEIEFVPTTWSGIIPALLADKFDVIIGGMSVTTQRNLKVNFSAPYDYTGIGILASLKKGGDIHSLEDVNKEGVIIVARIGSTPAAAAKQYFPKAAVRLFEKETQCVQELMTGRATVMLASAPLPAFKAYEFPKKLFVPVKGTFTKEPIAFALRKGDPDTLNVLNNWIRIKQDSGWLKARKDYWFEGKQWENMLK
ncbi:transporter substrate-binding domain-containing protein [Halodesulfovibrio aestuarii]|uniref:Amino acid ABC transporter substrate-binding protein, PAAT family (TC 3.A.1.3.-) n=1 Tax=Halodesulfovibrio aestuarii TaxID=126333 RepID=A0A8G2C9Y2_9BACT|nr:transporter substrate-binding domain-containing protein [Halodesulfovibrio aestuarii]SHJ22946.1 amino acid ABC transporter substrate-binding protein, PAAT family (TC 3.A.1.3.-) [Halodesulfovibrio aestuarii]